MPFEKYRLLERNDTGVYRVDATLDWLAKVRQAILDVEDERGFQWYTTYDLIVLIPDVSAQESQNSRDYQPAILSSEINTLECRIAALYSEFKVRYEALYAHLQQRDVMVNSDQVWLRWLEESYHLIVSLLSSRLCIDLGICLISQFMDMLEYGRRLFSYPERFQLEDLEQIQNNFCKFFSNIAVLIDSMNQTNRQFVLVPSFHLPSFEIPPQIMAYYTVVVKKIREALRDEGSDIFYGFTISPKLVRTLSVESLSLLNILPEDEWISVNMDEAAFYALQLTTDTIAHEVSHFVGEEMRNREFRKECILKCALQSLLISVIGRFTSQVQELLKAAYGETRSISIVKMHLDDLNCAAAALWDAVKDVDLEKYDAKEENFSRDLEPIIWNLPQDIANVPTLAHAAFEQVWKLIHKGESSQEENCIGLLDGLNLLVKWKLDIKADASGTDSQETFRAIVESEAEDIFIDVIEDLAANLECTWNGVPIVEGDRVGQELQQLCEMFRETFADLQAIILLGMKWEDYCKLLLPTNDRPGRDHLARMYSVAKALIRCDFWDGDCSYGGDAFSKIRSAIPLDPLSDSHVLARVGIPPTLSFYLIEYLAVCANDILDSFGQEPARQRVEELREIHNILSGKASFLALQKMVSSLTNQYWKELLHK